MPLPVHWRAQVKVFYAYAHIIRSGCAEYAVPQDFGRPQIGGMSSDVACILDEVSTSSEANSVWVLLF